ncbi:hypothetical protein P256_02304 [Acinetobacter nectaris CIP 110549]|uniref:Uncharacterized protein n=1 Tax=Acinetobacter nectaris CIP 110549 TaxID=1392540 RepID=V2UPH9_9GAMM|nr:hypothetical protein [Acinetobacter nectaris]ESK37249.1 hypothetical protein P256_02304 [Acinetobacter nectaris CIP 110549]
MANALTLPQLLKQFKKYHSLPVARLIAESTNQMLAFIKAADTPNVTSKMIVSRTHLNSIFKLVSIFKHL